MDFRKLLLIALTSASVRFAKLLSPHGFPERTEIPSLLQTLDSRLTSVCQTEMPNRKASQDEANDPRDDAE